MRIPQLTLLVTLSLLAACGQNLQNTQNPQTLQTTTSKLTDTTQHTLTNKDTPHIPTAAELASFIPSGYSILDTASGDLNRDAARDMLLILRRNGEDTLDMDSAAKRPLLILIGQPGGSLKLAARNDNAVSCYKCGGMMGDPYQQMVIKNGYFSLEYYGGSSDRWSRTVTFNYSQTDSTWYLYKDGEDSYNTMDPHQKHKTRVYSIKDFGKIPFLKFDIESTFTTAH